MHLIISAERAWERGYYNTCSVSPDTQAKKGTQRKCSGSNKMPSLLVVVVVAVLCCSRIGLYLKHKKSGFNRPWQDDFPVFPTKYVKNRLQLQILC